MDVQEVEGKSIIYGVFIWHHVLDLNREGYKTPAWLWCFHAENLIKRKKKIVKSQLKKKTESKREREKERVRGLHLTYSWCSSQTPDMVLLF